MQFLPLERPPEVILEFGSGTGRGDDGGVEDLAASFPKGVCAVEGSLGIAQGFFRFAVSRGTQGDADAGREKHFRAIQLERRGHVLQQLRGDGYGLVQRRQSFEQD